ncbi:MAG: TetR/AcrR family transcriptional regulator [Acidimicrobiales bacterium]|nr:TetR/AcrR family transcriptional regulator [Acidimicrobiales bacterium]
MNAVAPSAPIAVVDPPAHDPLTDRLLAAAVDLFIEKGFDKAGVAAIARRAGVTTGAIYSRWTGKQEMMLDAIGLVMHEQLDRLLSAGTSSLTDVLSALGAELVVRSDTADILLAEALVIARRDPEFHTMLSRRLLDQEQRLAELFEAGKRTGEIDPALPTDAMVALCHAIAIGFAMFGSIDREFPAADGWNAVIERLITAARPHPTPTNPTRTNEDN